MLTIDKLKEYGADVQSGLQRCVNNESLYLRLVGMVPNNASFKELYTKIESNDLEGAFSAAHSLKGITANLSLTPLVVLVNEITELLRNKTQMDYSKLINDIEEKRSLLEKLCNN
ncbi:MAG: Hpt domain-containing protein [Bacilli bacterium]|nr:Hpt domain-containing protein [Bacilli bacterium]